MRREREREHTIVDRVRILAKVGQLDGCPEQPTGRQLEGDRQLELGRLVDRLDLDRRRPGDDQSRRPLAWRHD